MKRVSQLALGVVLGLAAWLGDLPPSWAATDPLGLPGGGGGQMCPAPGLPITTGQPNTCGSEAAGNPINVMGGNKFQTEVDFAALPGVLGLELVRYYNSDFSRHFKGAGLAKGSAGRGWGNSYELYLKVGGADSAGLVEFVSADGQRQSFRHSAQTPHIYRAANVGALIERSGAPGAIRFELRQASGMRYRFNAQGWLMAIEAPTGELLKIERDRQMRIQTVTDPQGRQLVMRYEGQSRQAQSVETPLGMFRYSFGHSNAPKNKSKLESMAQVAALTSTLSEVTAPDGSARRYHYEDSSQPTLLTGISVKAGIATAATVPNTAATTAPQSEWIRTVSWAYNEKGQAIRSVKGPVPAQGQSGPQDVALELKRGVPQSNGGLSGVTILTNSLGQRTRYEYTEQNGRNELFQVLGAGCASCGPVNWRSVFDTRGRLIERIQLSPVQIKEDDGLPLQTPQALSATRYSRDPQGRVVRIEQIAYDAAGTALPARLIERTEFNAPRWPDKPTLVARPSVIKGAEQLTRLSYNAAGQVTKVVETGYSPLDDKGQLAKDLSQASKLERATVYSYQTINGRSVLAQIDGPLPNGPTASPQDSDITRLEWDAKGDRVQAVLHPMGLREQLAYELQGANPSGRLVSKSGVNGVSTTLSWDTQGRVVGMQSAGLSVSLTYDPEGRVVRYQRNDGAAISADYDTAQNRVAYTLPDGEVLRRQLDSEQRLLTSGWQSGDKAENSLVAQTQVEYDPHFNRPTRWTDPAGVSTELTFDAQGRLASQQRGALTTRQSFDPAERLLQVQQNEAVYKFQSDAQGQQTELSLPTGAQHRQWQDDFGRTVRVSHPETGDSWANLMRPTTRQPATTAAARPRPALMPWAGSSRCATAAEQARAAQLSKQSAPMNTPPSCSPNTPTAVPCSHAFKRPGKTTPLNTTPRPAWWPTPWSSKPQQRQTHQRAAKPPKQPSPA